jgi:hypothetical protein
MAISAGVTSNSFHEGIGPGLISMLCVYSLMRIRIPIMALKIALFALAAVLASQWTVAQESNYLDLHPILLLRHKVWHEGYHRGQIKLALRVAGRPMTDEEAGPVTWDVWMRKK